MKQRLPLAISTIALAVAITGTPISEGAVHAVRRALFANNAGAVNGIKASRTPRPHQLVALNARGHFPSSVLSIPTGPPGPQGAAGAQGPAGVSHAYFHAFPEVAITGTTPTRLASITLPGGKYLVTGYANLSNLTTSGTSGICDLHVVGAPPLNDDDEDYYSLAPEGTAPWRKRLVLYLLDDFGPNGGQVEMTCHADTSGPGSASSDWVNIAALQVDSLTVAPAP